MNRIIFIDMVDDPIASSSNGAGLSALAAADRTVAVTRGVVRLLTEMNQACLTEFALRTGRRVDVIALDPKGQVTIVEVKVSVSDYRGDAKWREYLPYCDAFYFATPVDSPLEMLPADIGVITADAYGAAILNPAAIGGMNASRRRALTLRFARQGALRLTRETPTLENLPSPD